MQNREFYIKNYDDISNKPTPNKNWMKLKIHILTPNYLDKRRSCFIGIISKDQKLIKDVKEKPTIISNSNIKAKKKNRFI